jgi:RecJ-like exonuclease
MVITLFTEAGVEIEVSLPAKFEVCPTCAGKGTHVNRAIDGNGLTHEDFDADPDFAEAYRRGDYDVPCTECQGERVVAVVDEARFTADARAQWDQHCRAEKEARRDWDSEHFLRMAEAGERW